MSIWFNRSLLRPFLTANTKLFGEKMMLLSLIKYFWVSLNPVKLSQIPAFICFCSSASAIASKLGYSIKTALKLKFDINFLKAILVASFGMTPIFWSFKSVICFISKSSEVKTCPHTFKTDSWLKSSLASRCGKCQISGNKSISPLSSFL